MIQRNNAIIHPEFNNGLIYAHCTFPKRGLCFCWSLPLGNVHVVNTIILAAIHLELCVTEAFQSDAILLRRWQYEDLLSNPKTARKCNLTLRSENFRRTFKATCCWIWLIAQYLRPCKSIWGVLISGLASTVFAALDAQSTVLEVLQGYLMCTK